jgi:hypothetical protein
MPQGNSRQASRPRRPDRTPAPKKQTRHAYAGRVHVSSRSSGDRFFVKLRDDARDWRRSHLAAHKLAKLLVYKEKIKSYNLLSSHLPRFSARQERKSDPPDHTASPECGHDLLIGFNMEPTLGHHARV